MSQSWNRLEQPIVTIAKPIEVWLEPSREGHLCLRAKKDPLPQGELYFLASNWSQTSHWLIPAKAEGESLSGDLSGAESAYDPEDDRPVLVDLALGTEQGLIRYPLRADRLRNQMSERNRCLYFFDERKWYSGPIDAFVQGDRLMEAFPGFTPGMSKEIALGIYIRPRSLRYWQQLSYGLTQMEETGEQLICRFREPEGAPELVGLSLHRLDGEETTQQFFPVRGSGEERFAAVDLNRLPVDGAEYALSGVCQQEGDILYHAPLSVIEPKLHQRLEERANGLPCREADHRRCWLRLDDLCRPSFVASGSHPDSQSAVPGMTLKTALEEDQLPIAGHCGIRDLGGEDWQWHFEVPNIVLEQSAEVWVMAVFQLDRIVLPVQILSSQSQDTLLSVDLRPLVGHIQTSRMTRWELSLAFDREGGWYHLRMRCASHMARRNLDVDPEYLDFTRCYSGVLGTSPMGDHQVQAILCCVSDGYCMLQTQDPVKRYLYQLSCRTEQVELVGTRLKLWVRCPQRIPGKWTGIMLAHRFKLEADREMYFIPANNLLRKNGYDLMQVNANLSRFTFSPLYWDIRAVFETQSGQQYLVRALAPRSLSMTKRRQKWLKLKRKIQRVLVSGSYRQGKDLAVSLYQTSAFGYALVCQEYTPYSGLRFRIKERLALILSVLFRRQLAKKSIFLCYEKYCCMAQDNGFYFFRYCMEHDMERKMGRSIYFVIDKKQPDYQERLLPYKDHVIQFMSLKHMVYLLAARLLISSDSKAHAYAWRAKESVILPRIGNRKKLVFLQHGVIALKRVEFYSKGTNAVQLFVTSNQREHDIIVREMDYPPEDVIITGLARWDVLEDKGLKERHILVMPTWRNWLEEVSDNAFMTSDYYRNYMALLNDPRLARLLEQHDLYLDFYIHPKFRDYISDFSITEGGRVRLIPFGTQPLNQLIMGCKLLVTDYSSVCWDVYYQGKPVLFYQFDVEQYNETTGSYIDLKTELFGDRAERPEELLSLLETYAQNNFALPEKYAQMRPQMYAYLDHNNSQRTCEEIMKRHW